MVELLGTFDGVQYRYRCCRCLTPMQLSGALGSWCPSCKQADGGFYLPIAGEPPVITVAMRRQLSTKARKTRKWRWVFGDCGTWEPLLV